MFVTYYSKSSHVFSGLSLSPHLLLFFSFADSILYRPSVSHSLFLQGGSMLPPGDFKVLLQLVDQLVWLCEGGWGCACDRWLFDFVYRSIKVISVWIGVLVHSDNTQTYIHITNLNKLL